MLQLQHVAIDVLVRLSRKSAAKCGLHGELYDPVNQYNLKRTLCFRIVHERAYCSLQINFA